jgi:DNA primase
VSADQIETFRLGYAPPDGRRLRHYLRERGYGEEDMLAAGAVVRSSRSNRVYSPFRDRIIFPVDDRRGRVIAFGGRLLPEPLRAPDQGAHQPPKYLNSPDTPLFHKGRTLYGEPHARQALGPARSLLLVEGYTDVLACHKAGFPAVAPLGTALTEEQILLLWQMIPEPPKVPILCFDGDGAGQRAARAACEKILPLLRPNHSVRFAVLPRGEDPDTLLATQGSAAFQSVLERAIPLDQYLWLVHTAGQRFETPEARAGLEEAVHAEVAAIRHETVRHYYREALDEKLRQFFSSGADPHLQQHFTAAKTMAP